MKVLKGWGIKLVAILIGLSLMLSFAVQPARADTHQNLDDLELARKYAPALYFHPGELFRPQSVDVIINQARLRQARAFWSDINILAEVSIADLIEFNGEDFSLDAWYGDEGASDYKNYTMHRAFYQAVLSPEAGGPEVLTYAHVEHEETSGRISIQYWLFYYYNDWFNKHEGDWEMVQVLLSADAAPEWVVYSQHNGGTRRSWRDTQVEAETHPAVYVALGSHANYFRGDEIYPNIQEIGNISIEIMDRTGSVARLIPEVVLIPDPEQIQQNSDLWQGFEWLLFGGHWGETAPQADFGGPLGPAYKGAQWEQPIAWGMQQPLDKYTWYTNRLRVELRGTGAENSTIDLVDNDQIPLGEVESVGGLAILHEDLPAGEGLTALITADPGETYEVRVVVPDKANSQTSGYSFAAVQLNNFGKAALIIDGDTAPFITLPGESGSILPSTAQVFPAVWDAPDVVWVAGLLPASEVLRGFSVSILAAVLPALLYGGLLYWSDRHEKEPSHMLAATFIWGAVPAIMVAVAVSLFFELPVDLLGPQALEAVRAGLVTPIVEESLKAMVVLFIALRYRYEFDNVLDGVVYGGMVGLGFAMSANLISYLGSFFLRGFSGLSPSIFIEGILFGINHAWYTAIFGAGLGYVRLLQNKRKRLFIPIGAYILAVVVHGLHNLILRIAFGLNLLTILITWLGVLLLALVIVLSVQNERKVIRGLLSGVIPTGWLKISVSSKHRWSYYLKAYQREGIGGVLRIRKLVQSIVELAFKLHQHNKLPDDPGLIDIIDELQIEVRAGIERFAATGLYPEIA